MPTTMEFFLLEYYTKYNQAFLIMFVVHKFKDSKATLYGIKGKKG